MTQVADFVLQRLTEWGVRRVYGYPGDGINGLLGAFDRAKGEPEFIQTRHEEMAAFMACAHAKFTGEVGCCTATSGPGAIHLLNGLYDAKLDHQPVVAVVGQHKRLSLGTHYQQEVDLERLFADVSDFCQMIVHPGQARHVVDRAFKTALTLRSVATVVIPSDVQEEDAQPSPPKAHGSVFSSVGWSRPRLLPDPDELRKAADVLNAGTKVAMIVGQGAAHAESELVEVAELLGAGVAKALLGREVLPDDLPFVTGPIGLLGSKARATHPMSRPIAPTPASSRPDSSMRRTPPSTRDRVSPFVMVASKGGGTRLGIRTPVASIAGRFLIDRLTTAAAPRPGRPSRPSGDDENGNGRPGEGDPPEQRRGDVRRYDVSEAAPERCAGADTAVRARTFPGGMKSPAGEATVGPAAVVTAPGTTRAARAYGWEVAAAAGARRDGPQDRAGAGRAGSCDSVGEDARPGA
ncbi:hypothetical protein SCANM63S_05664 [Streptomyces canarius]